MNAVVNTSRDAGDSGGLGTGVESEAARLGRRVAALREHKRWSARTLAGAAGVSPAYLREIEQGRGTHASGAVLDAIARALEWPNYHALLESEALDPPLVMARPDVEALIEEVSDRVLQKFVDGLRSGRINLRDAAGGSGGNAGRQVARYRARPKRLVFRYGAAGDPADAADLPDVVDEREAPEEFEDELGDDCYGVYIRGESLSGLGIHDGDVAWCRRQEHAALLETVAAVVSSAAEDDSDAEWDGGSDGTKKIVVKQYRQGRGLQPGLWSAEENQNPEPTGWRQFAIRGVVVCVQAAEKVFTPAVVAPRARAAPPW